MKKILILVLVVIALSMTTRSWAIESIVVETIMGESANQSFAGQLAVAEVIRHRIEKGNFDTLEQGAWIVCYEPKQFSFWDNPPMANDWLSRHGTGVAFQTAARAWEMAAHTNTTNGATHYCRFDCHPKWRKKMKKVATVGDHVFYK